MDELTLKLKRAGVLRSNAVETAWRAIDRKDFIPAESAGEAYEDHPLPIGAGQTISQPYTVAFMLDLLDPRPGEKILDIGAGSGWQTAILAEIVRKKPGSRVYAVERIQELCDLGRANLSKYGFLKSGVVELICADASSGLPDKAPFDKIIAAAAGKKLPPAWRENVKIGGVIVAPMNSSIFRYRKTGPDQWSEEEFPGFAFVPFITGRGGSPKDGDEEAKTRRRKPRLFNKRRLATLLLFLAIGVYTVAAPVKLLRPARFNIEPGSGSRVIAGQLKKYGLIRSKWFFVTYATLIGRASDLKPGAYEFNGYITVPAIASALVRGESNERAITIPEGWDLRDIGTYLEELGIAERNELYAITGEPAHSYGKNASFPPPEFSIALPPSISAKPPRAILEGYLYPDTYRVFRDASVADIVTKMLANFERKVAPLRAEIEKRGKSVAEVITVASLIEKEVTGERERRMVAGIIWRRLADGMALQIDASVNYATSKRFTPTAEDLAAISPYNTYRHTGLPPTPISNPGLDAIRAAIDPAPSEYRYYLSSPDGRTIFSRTFEEHTAAKIRYLR